ncbi:MAG TPA: ADOP family duplicated permease [Lacunisphaera sp.]|nr:ADOP family duplicated permease [Lacunisphaera sp.]
MPDFLQDLKFSLRLFAKSPGFTAAAIAVLALGIGLNTAMFSFVHALIFQPRPYPEPDRIVQIYTHDEKQPDRYRAFDYATYRELRDRPDVFSGVLAHHISQVGVGEPGGNVRRAFGDIVSANFFSVLGVNPVRGRFFTAEEEKPGAAAPVVVVSHQYWRNRGARDDLVGSELRINGRPYTIVGVTPENFSGTMMLVGPEFYFPLGAFDVLLNDFETVDQRRSLEQPGTFRLLLLGRLRRGVTPESARASLAGLSAALRERYPVENKDQVLAIAPLPRFGTSPRPMEDGGLGLFGGVLIALTAAVLLIICLNLAGLILARGHSRRREIAIRLAMGGGRGRIVRQLLVEGFVLSLGGGIVGLLLAFAATKLILSALAERVPVAIFFPGVASGPAVIAMLLFCGFATLCCALGPAVKLSRTDVLADLKLQAGEDHVPRRRAWLPRYPLVVAQLSLSLALVIAAGLFVRMVQTATAVDIGYRADDTIIAEVDASLGGHGETRTRELYQNLERRLAALPGAGAASIGVIIPHSTIDINRPVQRAGFMLDPEAKPATAAEGRFFYVPWNAVGADYFRAMGLPMLRGRAFTRAETEDRDSPLVAVIDEALARKLWPDGDALGQQIQIPPRAGDAPSDRPKPLEVVGIVANVHNDYFEDEFRGAIYVPFAQGFMSNVHFHVRPAPGIAPDALIDGVRRELREGAPGVPVFKVQTFRQHLETSLEFWAMRLCSFLFLAFGGTAMLIAVVGVYGAKSYAVSRRTREIGIRLALGAEAERVRNLILREGLSLTLTGLGFGLLLGLGVGRLLATVFVDFNGFDVLPYAVAALTLFVAAMVACWVPARRATRVNPLEALRAE